MKVLFLWPPEVPTYFNAGHRNFFWETAAYVRKMPGVAHVTAYDTGVLNHTWGSTCKLLLERPDVLAVANDFEMLGATKKAVRYCREISPSTKIVTFGRASSTVPGSLEALEVDAIASSGDTELSVANAVEYFAGRKSLSELSGLRVRRSDGSYVDTAAGSYLPAEELCFPDVTEVPWEHYNRLYENANLKYSGLPHLAELPVSISRGCPVGCNFCLVWQHHGLRERRHSVEAVLDYADRAYQVYPFDYLSTYSPTFTLQRSWVMAFSEELETNPRPYRWKTCTTVHHLDPEMIAAFARSGCLRISVGVETLEEASAAQLPKLKRIEHEKLRSVADACRAGSIELNCFIILGLPGQTLEGLYGTYRFLREIGAAVRPTIYAPFDQLDSHATVDDVEQHSKHSVVDNTIAGCTAEDVYRLRYEMSEELFQELLSARRGRVASLPLIAAASR